MKRYTTYKELASAFASGELDKSKVQLMMDNDDSWLSPIRQEGEDDFAYDERADVISDWFRGNGRFDICKACEAAGIPVEEV